MQAAGCEEEDNDVLYKDVVVIGNGPSGICLSYMLAGNWPYYTGEPHPGDEMLTARLNFSTQAECRMETEEDDDEEEDDDANDARNDRLRPPRRPPTVRVQGQGRGLARSTRCKLECLSSGLEGRSGGRPLALLMDQLQHPCVDQGLDVPSLLTWRSVQQHPEHKVIEHVVLGKGQPGGAWQSMDPNVLTISLSRWMSLPDLDIRHWEMLVESEQQQHHQQQQQQQNTSVSDASCDASSTRLYAPQEKIGACKTASRVSVGTVAAYYKDYVRIKGLEQYFRCGTVVTSVRPVSMVAGDDTGDDYGWMVEGHERRTGKRFRYRCKKAVLATGTTDLSNHLGIPNENTEPEWVTHDLNDLEARLDRLVSQNGESLERRVKPVLVVGAGLSAADAIMAARFRGIPVLHAFRDSSTEWSKRTTEKITTSYDRLQWLPSSIYPEYHKVYEMMADGGTNYPLYKSLPGHMLIDLRNGDDDDEGCRTVTLSGPDGQLRNFSVSIVAILIGYKPDLSYLEGNGIGLGRCPDRPIDSKSNPIEIDDFTYEVVKAPAKGLYALGPLVGDNFVRFILGGAFGILAHILSTSTT